MKTTQSPSRSDQADFYPHKPYDQKLLDVLLTMAKYEWFRIDNRDDFEKITATVKGFIDEKYPFEFSNDMKKIRRITNYE
jgi:hypothetical protein